MKKTSKSLSIIAFYLSEYDDDAVDRLGFKNKTQAFKEISVKFDRDNNYLKLRRDEFDALPTSRSNRKGWRNRPPTKDVVELAEYLSQYTFEELTEIVQSLIENADNSESIVVNESYETNIIEKYEILSEEEIERIVNLTDDNSDYIVKNKDGKVRRYRKSIIKQLKLLYSGKCQLCGEVIFEQMGVAICEAHHIQSFAETHNNNVNNIIILCPNHHRLIHKLNPRFDREKLEFVYSNGIIEKIKCDYHL